ncbi:MAG: hypothetical protein M1814_004479 [Vezdaea aestivalis]|nr:MAG: hypothetical protein M1814_004479 [Vezdaea aestivalis]
MGLKELKSRSLSDYVFTQIYQTRWSDNDMYQHMNNSIYFFLYDSIVNNYLMQHAGLDPSTSNEIGLIVNAGSNYFRSVRFPDIVELGLRVNRIGSSSVAYEIGVFKQGEKSKVEQAN